MNIQFIHVPSEFMMRYRSRTVLPALLFSVIIVVKMAVMLVSMLGVAAGMLCVYILQCKDDESC